MASHTYTAYVEYDPETKLYVGIVPSLPGAHSQGATLDELQHNLQEVVALCLEEKAERGELGAVQWVWRETNQDVRG